MVSLSWEVGAYDEVQLKKLKALGSCPACDLSNADLAGAILTGADLTDANLTEAVMRKAKIQKAKFCRTQTPWGEENSGC